MPDQHIVCPKCGNKIPLTEAFTHEIEERLRGQFNAKYKHDIENKEKEFEEKLKAERQLLESSARKHAEESVALQLKDLEAQLQERSKQLEDARQQELDLRKRQRQLEEREKNLQLELTRQIDDERKRIWDEATKRITEEQQLKEAEKDKQLTDLKRQIEELKRKAELTSQQLRGEVQEVELETMLTEQFRLDAIDPVPKGKRGADVIQHVRDESGTLCGSIIWESKRTKLWSAEWIQKLRDDQRAAKADIAIIVSTVLPKEFKHFGYCDGVWITDFPSAVGVATALRYTVMELAHVRRAMVSKSDKMELIYSYLTGGSFRQRIQAVVESFVVMKNDLDGERRAMEKLWAKREMQINRVFQGMAGLRGDLEGIIGKELPEVKVLELPSSNGE